jgi:hypothetical protein
LRTSDTSSGHELIARGARRRRERATIDAATEDEEVVGAVDAPLDEEDVVGDTPAEEEVDEIGDGDAPAARADEEVGCVDVPTAGEERATDGLPAPTAEQPDEKDDEEHIGQ